MAGLRATSGKLTIAELIDRIGDEKMAAITRAAGPILGERMVQNLRAVTRRRTGRLAGGWTFRVIDDRTIEVSNPVPYARPHNDGSRPHVIRPRPPLRAIAYKVPGGMVVRSSVQHPGTKREDVFKRGQLRTLPAFMVFLRTKVLQAILEGAKA